MNEENNKEQDKNRWSDGLLKCYSATCINRDDNSFHCKRYNSNVSNYGLDDIGPFYIPLISGSMHKDYFAVCDHRFSTTTTRTLQDNNRILGLSKGSLYDYLLKINARNAMDTSIYTDEHPLNDIIEDRMRPIKNAIMEIDI